MSRTTEIETLKRKSESQAEGVTRYAPSRGPRPLSRLALSEFAKAVKKRKETYTPKRIDARGIRWVVACVRSGDEHGVAEVLSRIGFLVYLPLKRFVAFRARSVAGKRVRRTYIVPVFGRYLFVGETSRELDRFDCDRVIDVLRPPKHKRVEAEIDKINLAEVRGKFDFDVKSARWAPDQKPLKRGDSVRVKGGPFDQFAAVIEEINASGRVKIAVELFGGKTPTEVDARDLEHIDS
jgi:transcription antitermination factor NusG